MKKIKRGVLYFFLAAIAVVGWMNRGPVTQFTSTQWRKLTGAVADPTGAITNGEKTKNKAKELNELAKKRNEIVDGL